MLPTLTPIDDGWWRLFWSPFGWEFEHAIPPEAAACFKVAVVTGLMLLIAWTLQRWENHNADPRRK